MWLTSDLAAMATELAELPGASLGLTLLSGMPLLVGMALVGIATYAALGLRRWGFRLVEMLISGLVGAVTASYLMKLAITPPHWGAVAAAMFIPHLDGAGRIGLAVGIVGATVMPDAIYFESSLTQARLPFANARERRTALLMSNRELLRALGVAGLPYRSSGLCRLERRDHSAIRVSLLAAPPAHEGPTPLLISAWRRSVDLLLRQAAASPARLRSAHGTKRNCLGAHGLSGAEGRPAVPSTWLRQPPLTHERHSSEKFSGRLPRSSRRRCRGQPAGS